MATATDNNHKVVSPVNTQKRQEIDIQPGDTVRVVVKVPEGNGSHRLQPFEGIVLAQKHGSEPGATFTVRKVVDGVGVEKIFPLYSPRIDEISIIRRVDTRRSKLYHIRDKAAKQVRREMRKMVNVDITTKVEDDEEGDQEEESEASEAEEEPQEEVSEDSDEDNEDGSQEEAETPEEQEENEDGQE